MTLSPTMDTVKIIVERTIDATSARVYTALTNADEWANWFCGRAELYTGNDGLGAYFAVWFQENYFASGVIQKLVENSEVVATWRGKGEASDSLMTFNLSENDGKTTVTLTHSLIDAGSVDTYQSNWDKRLDDLKLYIETGALPNVVNRIIIGIFPANVPADRATELGLGANEGTLVGGLIDGFGAQKAGLLRNDILVTVDGNKLDQQHPINVFLGGKKPGDSVEIGFYRGSELMSLPMTLSGYPVPAMPASFAQLADQTAQEYVQVLGELKALFEGKSDAQAGKAPKEGEWSAKLVLAHLIFCERFIQNEIAGRYTGGAPRYWAGNDNDRLGAMVAAYPALTDLLNLFEREMNETVAVLRHFPQSAVDSNKNHLWAQTFSMNNWIVHTRSHFTQITEALQSA